MAYNLNLISNGASILGRTKRYIIWFFLLNLALAWFGASAFKVHAARIMDHSLYADKVLHGMDLEVVGELLNRPELGGAEGCVASATHFALLFFVLTLIFLPGVLQGYASDHRLPRDAFFRACGRNVWRFFRLMIFFLIIGGIVSGILFGLQAGLGKVLDKSQSNGAVPFAANLVCLLVIFLIMTGIRAWFDLAETDIVLSDQNASRKSLSFAWRMMRGHRVRLVWAYAVITLLATIVLAVGVVLWNRIVPPASVAGAFIVSQLMLLFWLTARFWQRAAAVSFYLAQTAGREAESAPVVPVLAA
jgi:hypothetical protein